jgi:enoyl-[acyl-carrier protein] reductase II
MLRTAFAQRAVAAEREGASKEAIATLFGTRRERMGIFEGDTEEGAMEAGQGSGLISDIPPAADIVRRLMEGYHAAKRSLP